MENYFGFGWYPHYYVVVWLMALREKPKSPFKASIMLKEFWPCSLLEPSITIWLDYIISNLFMQMSWVKNGLDFLPGGFLKQSLTYFIQYTYMTVSTTLWLFFLVVYVYCKIQQPTMKIQIYSYVSNLATSIFVFDIKWNMYVHCSIFSHGYLI